MSPQKANNVRDWILGIISILVVIIGGMFTVSFTSGSKTEKIEHLEREQIKLETTLNTLNRSKIDKDEYRVISDSLKGLGNFSLKELEGWQRKAYRRFYLNHNYLKSQIQSMLMKKDFSIIKGGFKLFKNIS